MKAWTVLDVVPVLAKEIEPLLLGQRPVHDLHGDRAFVVGATAEAILSSLPRA